MLYADGNTKYLNGQDSRENQDQDSEPKMIEIITDATIGLFLDDSAGSSSCKYLAKTASKANQTSRLDSITNPIALDLERDADHSDRETTSPPVIDTSVTPIAIKSAYTVTPLSRAIQRTASSRVYVTLRYARMNKQVPWTP